MEARLRLVPGIRGVSMSAALPPRGGAKFPSSLQAEGGAAPSQKVGVLPMIVVDSAFFSVLRLPLLRGRPFTAADAEGGPPVAIVDRDLAALLWPTKDALGRRFRMGPDEPWLTVVGVAQRANLVGETVSYSRYAVYRPERRSGGTAAPSRSRRPVIRNARQGPSAMRSGRWTRFSRLMAWHRCGMRSQRHW